jgi:hypothetical protein
MKIPFGYRSPFAEQEKRLERMWRDPESKPITTQEAFALIRKSEMRMKRDKTFEGFLYNKNDSRRKFNPPVKK